MIEKETQQCIRDGRCKESSDRSEGSCMAEWYDKMKTKEGEEEIHRIAKIRTKKGDV